MRNWEEESREPNAAGLAAIAEAMGVSLYWLLGLGQPMDVAERQPPYPAEPLPVELRISPGTPGRLEAGDFRAVPLVAGTVAAGTGRIVDEQVREHAIVHTSQLPGGGDLVAVRVDRAMGRSMLPLIRPGAIVIIDRRDKRIEPGRVYAVRDEAGGVALKYLQWAPPRLWLLSENPKEDLRWMDLTEDQAPEDLVVGRAVWVNQQL